MWPESLSHIIPQVQSWYKEWGVIPPEEYTEKTTYNVDFLLGKWLKFTQPNMAPYQFLDMTLDQEHYLHVYEQTTSLFGNPQEQSYVEYELDDCFFRINLDGSYHTQRENTQWLGSLPYGGVRVYQIFEVRNERFPMTLNYDHRTDIRSCKWKTGINGMTIWMKHCIEETGKEWRNVGVTWLENTTQRSDVGTKWRNWMEYICEEERLTCELLPFWGNERPIIRNGQPAISYS